MPLQWLYSTRGELALAEGHWDEAEHWLDRARAEAAHVQNQGQIVIVEANLGRAAAGRGDLDRATLLLGRAWQESVAAVTYFQRVQIGLWLAALESRRGDHERARAILAEASALIAADTDMALHAQAGQVRRSIDRAAEGA